MVRLSLCALALLTTSMVTVGTRELTASDQDAPRNQAAREAPSFQDEIRPLLQAKCIRCHGGQSQKAALDLSTPRGLSKGGESGPVIVAGAPEHSLLYEKVQNREMPPGKDSPLVEAEIDTLRRWIAAGARTGADEENSSPTPTLTQHDALPILLRHCTYCHGPRQQKGGLDLTSRSAMLKGGKSGPAIVAGNPRQSLLIKQIQQGRMPPPTLLVEASVKPVDAAETETLVKWIAAGAPEAAIEPDIATTTPDPLVSDKDRDYWAFQPTRHPPVPQVHAKSLARNPIDAFVLRSLESKGLSLAPEADRLTLLRRASFDLTGLPPEPDEALAYLDDQRPDAYERLIDRLLASPRHGERWGRHWLDLAGYSDSEGKREQDLPRPQAWRYRDYVIKSFNRDKSYSRFLMEQLAGDELADYEKAGEISEELADNLVATGFLRMAPDATWANITGYASDRVEVIADEIDVLGSAVLGLTIKCARCHSHKFDPIPQRDYYRLIAVFKGAYDEYDWLKPDVRQGLGPISLDVQGGRLLPHVTTAERREWEASEARITEAVKALRARLDQKANTLAAKHLEERLGKLPESIRSDVKVMLATAADKRNPIQQYLASKFEKELRIDREQLKKLDATFQRESDEDDAEVKRLEAKRREAPMIQALWDRGAPSPTYIYRRGDLNNPGRLVGPGVPSVLTDGKTPFEVKPPWPGAKSTGRRLAFARFVTQPDHPLTARVAVNRIWKHHFGSGIVKTLGNFGKAGTPPTHPELLDWLAGEFVRRGWSFKELHRLIMTSGTYRQSSDVTAQQRKIDPDNALYSRMPMTRLDAEALNDTLLLAAGRLNPRGYGPPDPVERRADGLVTPIGGAEGWRRMIYVRQSRKQMPTHLENFDFPQMNPNCIERRDSTVVLQALQLMNMGMVHELADRFASRVIEEAGMDQARQIDRVYLIATSRMPSADEGRIGLESLQELTRQWSITPAEPGKPNSAPPAQRALATYCHAIMNSAAFLYVD